MGLKKRKKEIILSYNIKQDKAPINLGTRFFLILIDLLKQRREE